MLRRALCALSVALAALAPADVRPVLDVTYTLSGSSYSLGSYPLYESVWHGTRWQAGPSLGFDTGTGAPVSGLGVWASFEDGLVVARVGLVGLVRQGAAPDVSIGLSLGFRL